MIELVLLLQADRRGACDRVVRDGIALEPLIFLGSVLPGHERPFQKVLSEKAHLVYSHSTRTEYV